ncbi:hypothetical protein SAMN05444320_105351 [Streptoalloteichus hindustanus]|uniref:Uncharacterized protein n=1 Tax=Streptoalloteichus hindustanus TaxID=2017 RepID=A0A1M5FC44_STRHI|nr:hypothetical protein SAMN05444320_105351 [Streptoalloteichus hindustanus]
MRFLLSLIDPDDAATVRARLRIDPPSESSESSESRLDGRVARELRLLWPPRAVLLWMLEQDDPVMNEFVFHHMEPSDTIKRDIVRGVPFGAAPGPLQVTWTCERPRCSHEEPEIPVSPLGLIGGLRQARSMSTARAATRAVSKADWPEVAEADRVEPLPGFTRWALSSRIDCPPELRVQFGSHPKFAHRQRRDGIVEPREYAARSTPARFVLGVLHLGTRLFPERANEAAELLAPLVRRDLGANPEAWAALAQVLPTFSGPAPELVRTCGASTDV